jgi:hypothetical protein
LDQFSYRHLNAQTQLMFLTQFTGITRLCIVAPGQISASRLADIVCSFPRLEVLALDCVHLEREWSTHTSGEEFALSPQTILRHFHTLHIFWPGS